MVGGTRVSPDDISDAPDAAERGAASQKWRNNQVHPLTVAGPAAAIGEGGGDRGNTRGVEGGGSGPEGEEAAWDVPDSTPRINASGTQEVYIPLKVAQAKVAEVEACMSAMKLSHLEIVREMEEEYKGIETDMQAYFTSYIAKLNDAAAIRAKDHQVGFKPIPKPSTLPDRIDNPPRPHPPC